MFLFFSPSTQQYYSVLRSPITDFESLRCIFKYPMACLVFSALRLGLSDIISPTK